MVVRCYWEIALQVVKRIGMVGVRWYWVVDGCAVLLGNGSAGSHGGVALLGSGMAGFHGGAVLLGNLIASESRNFNRKYRESRDFTRKVKRK